jgi:hypothetical protein
LGFGARRDRAQPLFYAQLEAAETVIFLVEGPADLRQGVQVPMDDPGPAAKEAGYRAFQRYALKMATGSGKTTVMGMLAAWSILNKISNPQAPEYSDTVLIVCPNITIHDRLEELDPKLDEASLYRTRELVPAHRMPDLRRGEVLITNWHNLERREARDVNGQAARVVKRGVTVDNTRVIRLTPTLTEQEEGGASQERPIIARGASGIRTTATVDFHTGKAIDEEHEHLRRLTLPARVEDRGVQVALGHDDFNRKSAALAQRKRLADRPRKVEPEVRADRRVASYFLRVPERAARGRRARRQDDLSTTRSEPG